MSKWISMKSGTRPADDKICLVSWKTSSEGCFIPIRAFYVLSEDAFFAIDSHFYFPLRVDIYCEIPELPNE
jgi:hypothetical protein